MYSLILIDADDTLFDYPKAENQALYNLFRTYNPEGLWQFQGRPVELEDWITTYKTINHQLWEDLEKGLVVAEDVKTMRFKKLFEYYQVPVDAKACSDKYLYYLSQGVFLLDGAVEICHYMHTYFKIVIVTNGFKEVQHARIEQSLLSPYIDHLVISEEVGSSKPDSGIFEAALAHMGVTDKSNVIMIGDSLSADMLGGVRFGIDTCWFNPHKKPNRLSNGEQLPVTYEITQLDQLKQILKNHD